MNRVGQCVHFTGIQNKACKAGIAYEDARVTHDPIPVAGPVTGLPGVARMSLPCLPPNAAKVVCPSYLEPTPEEIAADRAKIDAFVASLGANVSPCCKAAIDDSHVVKAGRYKGSGPRYCASCKKLLFTGCARPPYSRTRR